MSVIIYEGVNFSGGSIQLTPGDFDRQYLDNAATNTNGTTFYRNISSMRISPNTLVMVSDSSSISSDTTRVLIGPQDISNLGALGLDDKIASLKVRTYKESYFPQYGTVDVYDQPNFSGRFKKLTPGDYPLSRLTSPELGLGGISDNMIASLVVPQGYVAILYDGPNFDPSLKSTFIIGPANIAYLSDYGMQDKVSSMKIVSVDMPMSPIRTTIDPIDKKYQAWKARFKTPSQLDRRNRFDQSDVFRSVDLPPSVISRQNAERLRKELDAYDAQTEGFICKSNHLPSGVFCNYNTYSNKALWFIFLILIIVLVLLSMTICNQDNAGVQAVKKDAALYV